MRRIACALLVLLAACEPPGGGALPAPNQDGTSSLESVLAERRSTRAFESRALTTAQIGQLLWAAQGVTSERGYRTSPSAGGLYPLEVYVVTQEGVFHYVPRGHRMEVVRSGDLRSNLSQAALSQSSVGTAPAVFVITGVVARTQRKYGGRATRYVHMEAGHAAQNLLLQATAMGLGGVPVGAFEDDRLRSLLRLPRGEDPLYLLPVGHPR